ncbi:hypothetical protein BH10PLA1_BH10PLA1_23130 [soil metagenome]
MGAAHGGPQGGQKGAKRELAGEMQVKRTGPNHAFLAHPFLLYGDIEKPEHIANSTGREMICRRENRRISGRFQPIPANPRAGRELGRSARRKYFLRADFCAANSANRKPLAEWIDTAYRLRFAPPHCRQVAWRRVAIPRYADESRDTNGFRRPRSLGVPRDDNLLVNS